MKVKIVCMLLSAMIAGSGVTEISSADINDQTTGQSEVIYEQESDFTVTIPKKIALGTAKTAQYDVSVKGSVKADESVTVKPNETFDMSETAGRKTAVTATATQADTAWSCAEITDAGTAKSGSVTAAGLTAGDWSGELVFHINMKAESVAGEDVTLNASNLSEYAIAKVGNVVIPDMVIGSDGVKHKVVAIGNQAFYNLPGLASVTIPDTVTSIGAGAFANCRALASVTIPDTVTSIGASAFENCVELNNITIPSGLTAVNDKTFYQCSSLSNVNISDSVKSIGSYAFAGTGLSTISFSDKLTNIGNYAFYGCVVLQSITFSDNMLEATMQPYAFYGCTALKSVHCSDAWTVSIDAGIQFVDFNEHSDAIFSLINDTAHGGHSDKEWSFGIL